MRQCLTLPCAVCLCLLATRQFCVADVVFNPDGKMLAVSIPGLNLGSRNVVRIIDSETLEVEHRLWHARQISGLVWSRDGKRLIAHADGRSGRAGIAAYDTTDWEMSYSIEDRSVIAFSPRGEAFVSMDPRNVSELQVHSEETGEVLRTITLPTEHRLTRGAITGDGQKLILVSESFSDETFEAKGGLPRPNGSRVPFAKYEEYMVQDGKVSEVVVYRLSDGEMLARELAHFDAWPFATVYAFGDGIAMIDSSPMAVLAKPDGSTSLIALPAEIVWMRAFARDGSLIALNARGIKLLKPGASDPIALDAGSDRVENEEFIDFGLAPDGRLFFMTTAARIFRCSADYKVDLVRPVP